MKTPKILAYLLNKKFILCVLIGMLFLSAGFLIFNRNKEQKSSNQTLQKNEPIIAEEIAKDSDADGLKDWEEALWKTDPNNPDTDADGASDGQEIKENRNPLLAGPNDKIKTLESEKSAEIQTAESPSSLTDAIGQKLINDYLSIKLQSNEELSKTDKEELVKSLTSSIETVENRQEEYLKSDVKISENNDGEAIKNYGNSLALIIKNYFDPIPESEMTILKKALAVQDESALIDLEPIADAYRNAAKKISDLSVPPSFWDFHLALINNFNDIAKDIDAMQKSFSDPVHSLVAVNRYQKEAILTYLILRNINGYFSENKVVFQSNEPGKYFKAYLE